MFRWPSMLLTSLFIRIAVVKIKHPNFLTLCYQLFQVNPIKCHKHIIFSSIIRKSDKKVDYRDRGFDFIDKLIKTPMLKDIVFEFLVF